MQLVLRAIAVISFIVAIIWMIDAPGFEPLLAFLAGISTLLASLIVDKSKSANESLDQRNRRVMLNHVENFWIKGVLDKSLHGVALLELGIKEEPGAVSYPWTIKKASTNETLPAGKSILEIFQEVGMGRSLLILGAPGAGKTTMLLELTRQLIERARHDEYEPIPVVFNLVSWKKKQTLAVWLVEQLSLVYYVPKKTATAWVSKNQMLLLLDGLDEVGGDNRTKCVEAINEFRNENGITSLIVCSRIEEYSGAGDKLVMDGAITLQPLTLKQANAYFDSFGKSLSTVKQLLKKDKSLRELAQTPLMLSIMVLAYQDRKADNVIASGDVEKQRNQLFNTYIARMFERSTRARISPFTKQQTLRYLHWLAWMLIKHNIVTYQIEMMQPSWLKDKFQRYLYILFTGLLGGLVSGIMLGLVTGLFGGLNAGLFIGLTMGLFCVLAFGILSFATKEIKMVDRYKWSWVRLVFVLIAWMVVGPVSWLIWRNPAVLSGSLLLITVLGSLIEQQNEETNRPGDRLNRTFYNTFLIVLLIIVLSVLNSLLFNRVMLDTLATALMISPIIGLFIVGIGLIEHYALKSVLAQYGMLPWRLIPFLDYAVDLIFLRRVGGSYIFVHRLLMEHFAEMEIQPDKPGT